MKKFVMLLSVLCLLALSAVAFAQGSGDPVEAASAAASAAATGAITKVGAVLLSVAGAGIIFKVGRSWIKKIG